MASLAVIVLFTLTALYGTGVYWRYHIVDADAPRALVPVQKLMVRLFGAAQGTTPPYELQNLENQYQPPSLKRHFGPDGKDWGRHPLGTDGLGRDV